MLYIGDDGALIGDGGPDTWESVLHMPWEDYVDPIVKILGRAPEEHRTDRNYVLRPWFNTVARPDGVHLLDGGVDRFYSLPDGLYCRMLAYEIGRDRVIGRLLGLGNRILCEREEYSYLMAWATDQLQKTKRTARVLDHGCGMCHVSLALLGAGLAVTMYDHDIPARHVIMKALGQYGATYHGLRPERLRFVHAGLHKVDECGEFDMIISQDVLEHLLDPEDEVRRFAAILRKGGKLLCAPFFNSCSGNDPQHLFENDKYQDDKLFHGMIENVGFIPCKSDVNGVLKVWERT